MICTEGTHVSGNFEHINAVAQSRHGIEVPQAIHRIFLAKSVLLSSGLLQGCGELIDSAYKPLQGPETQFLMGDLRLSEPHQRLADR
jgi:hypothetical protein